MNNPLISIIIPYYKAGKFIQDAIESIRQQCYSPIEIIIIDDNSNDDVALRIKDFGEDIILLQQQENKGPSAARNLGIEYSKGEFIAFLDSDDIWPENKFTLQVNRLLDDSLIDIISGRIQYLDLPGAEKLEMIFEDNNTIRHVHLGATLIRRNVFDKIDYFNESMRLHEDVDFFMRIRENNLNLIIIKDITLIYRKHDSNMTRGDTVQDSRFLNMLKLSIDRRKNLYNKVINLKPFSAYDD